MFMFKFMYVSWSLQILNNSDTLPLHFRTHRLPHYTCHPPSGHIPPSQSHTLTLTFTPKQLGPLNTRLMLDIMAPKSKVHVCTYIHMHAYLWGANFCEVMKFSTHETAYGWSRAYMYARYTWIKMLNHECYFWRQFQTFNSHPQK